MKSIVVLCTLFLLMAGRSVACMCAMLPPLKELSQLEGYQFIAHVAITDDGDVAADRFKETGVLKFRIITLFKGKPQTQVVELSKNGSCDIGVGKGEEWILFAKEANGQLYIQPCDRNVMYRNVTGERDWQFKRGMEELDKLAELYRHPAPVYPDGVRTVLYPNGQKELQENYRQHQLEGERKLWYANGQQRASEYYQQGLTDGRVYWWYPSGQLQEEGIYKLGKPYNVRRTYYDTTLIPGLKRLLAPMIYSTEEAMVNEFKRIQVHFETVYAPDGKTLISREYQRSGLVKSEYFMNEKNDAGLHISYFDNGQMSTLSPQLNYRSIGRFYEFNKDGTLKRSGVYDDQGNYTWDPPAGK